MPRFNMQLIPGNIFIVLIFVAVGHSEPVRNENTFRIINGVTAAPLTTGESGTVMENNGQYPYIASLRKRSHIKSSSYVCSAAIIKKDVILTAAHCTNGVHPTNLTIRAGSFAVKDVDDQYAQKRDVKKYINHPEHNKNAPYNNDLGIVWLEKPFDLGKFINTIKLATSDYAGEDAIFIGWGFGHKHKLAEYLMRADFVLMSQHNCINAYRRLPDKKITDSMVCAIHKLKRQVVCDGDSGGPLIFRKDSNPKNDFLIGLTSWGIVLRYRHIQGNKIIVEDKCERSYPSVFSRLDYLRPWIQQYVQLDLMRFV